MHTRKWRIANKYLSNDFADFILNINDLDRDAMPIEGGGSLEEWAYHFQLKELYGITLEGLLRFFDNTGCVEVKRKENLVLLNHNVLELLRQEIIRRIEKAH